MNDVKKPSHSQSPPDLCSKLPSSEPEKVAEEVPVPADPMKFDKLSLVWGKPRQSPWSKEEWISFMDSEGRVVDSNALRKRVYYGGVIHELREEVWPFLLGFYDYNSTYAEREYLRSVRKQDYEIIKLQWQVVGSRNIVAFLIVSFLFYKEMLRTWGNGGITTLKLSVSLLLLFLFLFLFLFQAFPMHRRYCMFGYV